MKQGLIDFNSKDFRIVWVDDICICRHGDDYDEYIDDTEDGDRVPEAPRFTEEGMRTTAAEPLNTKVVLQCKASGWPHPTIRWTKDGIPIAEDRQYPFDLFRVSWFDLDLLNLANLARQFGSFLKPKWQSYFSCVYWKYLRSKYYGRWNKTSWFQIFIRSYFE